MNDFFTILLLSYNRKEFLHRCLKAIMETKKCNYKIVVYDNASTDGSVNMLKLIEDDVKVIYGKENIGQNAYCLMHEHCEGHVVTIDDDVIDIPSDWIYWFSRAIHEVPMLGYMSADVIQDDMTNGAKPSDEEYEYCYYKDIVLQEGKWTGGWCSAIPEWVYKEFGPYVYKPNLTWVPTDGFFCNKVRKAGYKVGILNNVKVYHATGPKWNEPYKELWEKKMEEAKRGGYA